MHARPNAKPFSRSEKAALRLISEDLTRLTGQPWSLIDSGELTGLEPERVDLLLKGHIGPVAYSILVMKSKDVERPKLFGSHSLYSLNVEREHEGKRTSETRTPIETFSDLQMQIADVVDLRAASREGIRRRFGAE